MEIGEKTPTKPPYLVLAILMIGAFVSFLNNTLLNVALPAIMVDLNVDTATVQWLTTGFMLVNGILIPTTAFLIQKYSVRRLFLFSLGMFTFGTVVAGLSQTFIILLIARMLQASGSAILMPLLMNVMLVSFPISKRGTAMGVFGLILMFAPAIGPTLSGWIIEHYNWRMLFYFIVPIAATCLILGFFLLKDKKGKVDIHLDVTSAILSSIGFGGLLYGFSSAGSIGWTSPLVYVTLMIGVISLILFIKRQGKLETPMLNFGVYRYPMFTLASVITMIVNMSMFSGFLLLPIYTQTILGISPMDTGLMLLPGALINAAMSPLIGRIFDKIGGRILAITGLSITLVTTYWFSQLTTETTYQSLVVFHAIRMFGMSMVFMPIATNGLNQLPRNLYPHGTAMNNTLNQVSAAIGTAVLITIMAVREKAVASQLLREVRGEGIALTEAVQKQIGIQAMLEGINFTFFVATFLVGAALILSFFIKRATGEEGPLQGNNEKRKISTKLVGNE